MKKITTLGKNFNWLNILTRLSKGAEIGESCFVSLRNKADMWPTCAVGTLCKKLPRFGSIPADSTLFVEGNRFDDYVTDRKWKLALRCFHRIEKRTVKLLAAQKKAK